MTSTPSLNRPPEVSGCFHFFSLWSPIQQPWYCLCFNCLPLSITMLHRYFLLMAAIIWICDCPTSCWNLISVLELGPNRRYLVHGDGFYKCLGDILPPVNVWVLTLLVSMTSFWSMHLCSLSLSCFLYPYVISAQISFPSPSSMSGNSLRPSPND